jgi:CheY-like chemotaxis protein
MLGARKLDTSPPAQTPVPRATRRVLIVQPNDDVRELIAEHCRRIGVEPLVASGKCHGELADIDAIVADPASPAAQRLLATLDRERRTPPIVFASIYPPAGRLVDSPAVAYLVLPCPWERFERALATALAAGR